MYGMNVGRGIKTSKLGYDKYRKKTYKSTVYDGQRLCENLIVELKCDNGPTIMNNKGIFS